MGKGKGKKGKGGSSDPQEPPHDPGWERSVENGKWDRPSEALPDASQWPTWGALRERILTNSVEITVTHTQSLRDAFPAEVVKLSPPNLKKMEFRGSPNLSQFVCSPVASCAALQTVDLSNCVSLQFVLIQSSNLEFLNLSRCPSLGKVLIQCKGLRSLNLEACDGLHTLMLWSDSLMELDLSSCKELRKLELYCPELYEDNIQMPKVKPLAPTDDPKHKPIAGLLLENYQEQQRRDADAREVERKQSTTSSVVPFTHMKV
eukprot:CAMPEP_0197591762 /NCGR_PEP_ID=MMETSP1326-20131121/13901_1 /TAXON_ID=1155430 /ORGANISM="Genus nov. species nov., Strain RCC2288" /LENGTH=260 /DNA_ID=CAMNT_0043157317 /DNA_START=19 /DNA_END=801 /DNA_ORIENTATION=-